ncbi:MAG: hypothetical protein M3319_10445 [Actinomycetota bacterium]|nr:hypothetical protein [Actinomycetota bacterium]
MGFATQRADISGDRAHRFFGRGLAVVMLVLVGMRYTTGPGMISTAVLAFVLIPVWLPAVGRYWGMRRLMGIGVCCVISGFWLTELASTDHETSPSQGISTSLLLLGALCGTGVILWARQFLPDATVALWFGIGLLASVALRPQLLAENPWKFALAVPVTVIVLAVAGRHRHRSAEFGALAALAGISAFNDSRSFTAILLLTGVLILWAARPARMTKHRASTLSVLTMAALGAAVYNVGTTAALEGYLGAEAQQRSVEQVETAGSLILGGRPELGATADLFVHRPWGFGAGTSASPAEVLKAKSGMAALGYDPNNDYVEKYMFGSGIELHSIIGDLWAWFGLPGAVLAAWGAWTTLRNLLTRVARREASALVIFLAVNALWVLLFGPFYSDWPALSLAVGLLGVPRSPDRAMPAGPARPRMSSTKTSTMHLQSTGSE